MITVKDLHKSYNGREVLKGIDLTVEKGDVVAIIGPSGSGKTTLLRCINLLEKADVGTLTFGDRDYDLSKITKKEKYDIHTQTAFVFQNYNLFLNKTVLQNVTEGLIVARRMDREAAKAKAMAALEKVGMAERPDAYPIQLSGGQQQRVAIARAIAADPQIIYFDEPTSALDPELIGEVLTVMKKLADEGMTMIVVTHEMNFARNISNKVIFMDGGSIVESAPSAQFFEHPGTERSRSFVESIMAARQ